VGLRQSQADDADMKSEGIGMPDTPQANGEPPLGPASRGPAPGGRVGKDLLPRVISGVVMAAVALGLTFAGFLPFAGMILAISAIVAWEWGRVVRGVDIDATTMAHIAAVIVAIALVTMGLVGLAMLALLIGAILVGLLATGRHPWTSAGGVAFAGLPGVALIWLREDPNFGLLAVLFVMAIVVVTDTAAYFSGRLIGGPRLWPSVSPNKTWAGLLGAVSASAVAGALYSGPVPGSSAPKLALLGAALAVIAQGGDLAESALKRRFGAKDASNIIPGHGGFMDRIDGLVTAAVAAAIFAAFLNVQDPARALLQW
jgi:phosphatidate cytidylyltransferase